jgi:hypothetical protein
MCLSIQRSPLLRSYEASRLVFSQLLNSLVPTCCLRVQVDAVFNLELPSSASHYAHRAGRTGRMGAPGMVMTFVAPGERFVVERLSKKLGVPIVVSVS